MTNPIENTSLNPLLNDIRSWADHFSYISFNLVQRRCDQVLDKLAKDAHNYSVTFTTHFYPPRFLWRYLFNDFVNTF